MKPRPAEPLATPDPDWPAIYLGHQVYFRERGTGSPGRVSRGPVTSTVRGRDGTTMIMIRRDSVPAFSVRKVGEALPRPFEAAATLRLPPAPTARVVAVRA